MGKATRAVSILLLASTVLGGCGDEPSISSTNGGNGESGFAGDGMNGGGMNGGGMNGGGTGTSGRTGTGGNAGTAGGTGTGGNAGTAGESAGGTENIGGNASTGGTESGGNAGNGGTGGSSGQFGDVGEACDPTVEDGTCRLICVELSDGSGVCSDWCGASGDIECPPDYKCNTIPSDSGEIDVCLPNASCGTLDYYGECANGTLRYCGLEGPIEFDCATLTGGNGAPLQCAEVSQEVGFDCVSSDFTGGCQGETTEGRCDGDSVIYCVSEASGEIATLACGGSGLTCVVAPDGTADCATDGATGCGGLTSQGECAGTVLRRCENDAIATQDCALANQVCAWGDDATGFLCADPPPPGANRARGTWLYEKRGLTEQGLGAISTEPVRQALVRVVRASDNGTVAWDYTDDMGSYDLTFEESTDVMVQVVATGSPETHPFSVRDCPLLDCGDGGDVYSSVTTAFAPSTDTNLADLVISEASGFAGAFNIFELFVRGADFAVQNFGAVPPALRVQWQSGSDTLCGTSCFSPQANTIFVLSTLNDTDEYDDAVLLHEYGHFLEHSFSRSDSPGGAHDGSPTDPRLAWGEGYGTYVGCTIAGSPIYIDSTASGTSVTNIDDTGERYAQANPRALAGMNQAISEFLTAEVLWDVATGAPGGAAGKGTAPVFDVLGGYFPTSGFADRGVQGVDLVDFLDGWFCRGNGDEDFIRDIVNVGHGFPYDYAAVASCP
jgi:hypothetical protein